MRPNVNFRGGLRTGVSPRRYGGVLLRVHWVLALCRACLAEDKSEKGPLRPAKSMDSLSAVAGANDGEYRHALACGEGSAGQ